MRRDFIEMLLVKLLLWLAIQMVELFNRMDDGPIDFEVVEKNKGDLPF